MIKLDIGDAIVQAGAAVACKDPGSPCPVCCRYFIRQLEEVFNVCDVRVTVTSKIDGYMAYHLEIVTPTEGVRAIR